ncbi:MAG: hypothetical protein IKM91_00975 [Candidatus Methanomethylophilaceae archaeon]|nr:hypothetical protein [Candidatus Methanomethylophilaceae archaeon]
MDRSERIAALRKAEDLLNEAADLMDEALHMSGMEGRTAGSSETIRRIASSPEFGGSLANIARDMAYEDIEQPCWTQPLTSPKNQPFDAARKTYIDSNHSQE